MSDSTSYISYISSTPVCTKILQKIGRHNKITPLRSCYLARAFPSKERRVLFTIPTYEWFAFLILLILRFF